MNFLDENGLGRLWAQIILKLNSKVPDGGTTGQVLKKTETGTEWADESCSADTVQSNLDTHVNNTDIHVTTEEKSAWNESILIGNKIFNLPITANWKAVTYGNDMFIAVPSDSQYLAYSADGTTWTESQTLWNGNGCNLIAYGRGIFCGIMSNGVFIYSNDGITWSNTTAPTSSSNWTSLTYGNGIFIATEYALGYIAYSSDGINWNYTTGSQKNLNSVAYGNGMFVIIGMNSCPMYSTDGITWNESTITNRQWMSVAYGNGRFVAVRYNGSNVAYSDDGITWTENTLPASDYWKAICYGNGVYVVIAKNSDNAAYSTDGVTWTATKLPVSSGWCSVTYGNSMFIAVGGDNNNVAYSTDGITWSNTKPSLQTVSGTDVTDDTKVILGLDKPITPESIGAATMTEVNAAIQTAIGNAIGGSY